MNINENARYIILQLKAHGYEAVLAGGCVRDYLLGLDPNDWDIATSATPEQIEKIFSHSIPVGKYFGVMTVLEGGDSFEVATFRTDGEYKDGRKPTSVTFSSIEEDAKRRDLTINGMFYDIISEEVIDFVGGQDDLTDRTIRFIGSADDRIKEDHLRLLRAIRFALRLHFTIDPLAMEAIKKWAPSLRKISSERIRDELEKIFSVGNFSEALELLSNTGILAQILPEVEAFRGCAQNPKFHPEGNVWNHTLLVMNAIPKFPTPVIIWGALLHDIGKPLTTEFSDGAFRSPMHEAVGENLAREILIRLKFPNSFINSVCYVVGNHMKIKQADKMRVSRVKKLLSSPDADALLEVSLADSASGEKDLGWHEYIQSHIEQWKKEELQPEPLISGRDLIEIGLKPSPNFSIILNAVYDEQLEGTVSTKKEAMRFAKEVIAKI